MSETPFRPCPWRKGRSVALALALIPAAIPASASEADPPSEFFESKVRPVLVESCQKCHGPKKQSGGLRLDSREAILEGGSTGPAVAPGDPDGSLLVQVVRQTHAEIKMPPKGKLPVEAVDALASWVKLGAPWPVAKAVTAGDDAASSHWAFRPVKPVAPPQVKAPGRVRTAVDRFIQAALDREGLTPSDEADRRTLIRRASFDLTGLPPTAAEVDSFLADDRPDAYERLVDRLLASPAYGERWGRHWLDVARYSDTKGYVFMEERAYPYAYTYRDYVVRAFNEDKPYDEFLIEQIAADRLGPDRDRRSLAALGYLTLGRRFLNNREDIIDDRIDVVSRGMLGLTVACARCHDHKFDPIPTDDYYALFGVFASSVEPADLPEIPAAVPEGLARDFREKLAAKQKTLDTALAAKRAEVEKDLTARLGAYFSAAVDLDFTPRNPKLDDRAKAEKLSTARLRGVMTRWKAHLDATRGKPDSVMAAWHAYAAVPTKDFAAGAAKLARDLCEKANPIIAKSFAEQPPKTMAEVAARYGAILAEADGRWRAAVKGGVKSLPEPEWEALRLAIDFDGGPLALKPDTLPRLLDRDERNKLAKVTNDVAALKASHPGSPPRAMVLNDSSTPFNPRVLVRGNPGRPGKEVPRQFLKVVSGSDRKPFKEGSGRLELARAIASKDNPLTARVMVNRVWLQHFGAGLVGTPSDFGLRSDPPSHPELLDWLADDFVKHGWSVKNLHRRIMLSATYRQRSVDRPDALAKDPENRLVWKANRRRLEFEAIRDSLLAASGALDPAMGGRPVTIAEAPFTTRRTIYGRIDRQNLDGLHRTFDFASPDSSTPKRFVTTVPQQALFLLNSPFVIDQARRLAARPEVAAGSAADRVEAFYRTVFGRRPDDPERVHGLAFVSQWAEAGTPHSDLSPWEAYAQVLLMTNEFVFID